MILPYRYPIHCESRLGGPLLYSHLKMPLELYKAKEECRTAATMMSGQTSFSKKPENST